MANSIRSSSRSRPPRWTGLSKRAWPQPGATKRAKPGCWWRRGVRPALARQRAVRQGTRSDPSPINERIASVHTALEVGERRGLDDLITSANAALGVLYGVAGRYGDALAVAERRLARAETRSRQELVDALRTAAVLTITIKGDFETGLELARRCHALARDAVAHQRMHITWPLAFVEALVALEDWRTLDKILPHARAAARGNALLEPICDRASGLMTAAYGDRRARRECTLSEP